MRVRWISFVVIIFSKAIIWTIGNCSTMIAEKPNKLIHNAYQVIVLQSGTFRLHQQQWVGTSSSTCWNCILHTKLTTTLFFEMRSTLDLGWYSSRSRQTSYHGPCCISNVTFCHKDAVYHAVCYHSHKTFPIRAISLCYKPQSNRVAFQLSRDLQDEAMMTGRESPILVGN